MANPNAHLKYLFLLNSEDLARAQPRFQTFVRDIGGKAQDVGLEDSLFQMWARDKAGDGILFREREQPLPNGSLISAHVVHIGEELVNNTRQPRPPVPWIQNKTSSAVS